MFKTGSNKSLRNTHPTVSSKLGYGIAAIAGAIILAGTVAVAAKTSGSENLTVASAVLEQKSQTARPLTIGLRGVKSSRKVRVIRIYAVSEDQKNFGAR